MAYFNSIFYFFHFTEIWIETDKNKTKINSWSSIKSLQLSWPLNVIAYSAVFISGGREFHSDSFL